MAKSLILIMLTLLVDITVDLLSEKFKALLKRKAKKIKILRTIILKFN